MSERCAAIRVVLWTGGDAPTRAAVLTIVRDTSSAYAFAYAAYYEPGYCGCEDCHPIVGRGRTAKEAVADYWTEWEERR